ncbi:DUF5776 domain-containing protein [Lentilactobacillus rapi]|uniref:DUF5776 domain-containing protein n=2 Tax=Lentilactobacillus rapi TaxID=481723 RepID=A0A512PNC0_9LACO|nr:DUF5776 domain-containing protein [Lentilactobacillus rapi]GEP72695.1 hypothetical protein LRA02_15630 [Lentilactobacillus rapi]
MANQRMFSNLARTVRLVVAVIAATIFGGLLMNSTTVRAAGPDKVTYILHAIDIYGNPIEAPFNGKEMVDTNLKKADVDVTPFVTRTLAEGRYVLSGYYGDDKDRQQMMDYNDFVRHPDWTESRLKAIEVYGRQSNSTAEVINTYFVYRDTQSKEPAQITIPDEAQKREPGKVKLFFTDVNGNEILDPIVYTGKPPYERLKPRFKMNMTNKEGTYRYYYRAVVARYADGGGTYIYSNQKVFANMMANVSDIVQQSILQVDYIYGVAVGEFEEGSTMTFVFEPLGPVQYNLTIEYVDENGKPIAGHPAQTKQVNVGAYTEEAPEIAGYTVTGDKTITGKLTNDATITFKYKKTVTPPNPGPTPGGDSNTNGNQTPTNPVKPTPEVTAPTTETAEQPAKVPNYAAKEGAAVYAVNHIYMYKNATFKKSQRIANYPKAKRINRPMFVVTDYARSNGGALRYEVRDVNHKSKTVGKTGYITANRKFVVRVYYSTMPKNKQVTVIAKKGVNAYKNANLTKKVKHYKTGTQLKVKKLVKHNLTTRYQLTNGNYVTANKKLIIQGNY